MYIYEIGIKISKHFIVKNQKKKKNIYIYIYI